MSRSSSGKRLEDVGDVGRMQTIENRLQLVQVLPLHELFDQGLLFFAGRLLALHECFDAALLFQQLLNARERALRRFRIVRLRSVPLRRVRVVVRS